MVGKAGRFEGVEGEVTGASRLTRREMITATGGAAAWSLLGASAARLWQQLQSERAVEKKEAALLELIRETEESLKTGEGARILKEGAPFEVYRLLFAPDSPLRQFGADTIKQTRLDPSQPRVYAYWPSVRLCRIQRGVDQHPDFPRLEPNIVVIAHDNQSNTDTVATLDTENSGNGIVMDSRHIVTNSHVAEGLGGNPPDLKAGFSVHPDMQTDAALISLPSDAEIPASVAEKMPKWEFMREDELQGTFVVAAGMDPDLSAGPSGLKYFGGFLIRMTEPLLKSMDLFGRMSDPGKLVGGYLFIGVPPGQALPVNVSTNPYSRSTFIYASGLSGSPLVPLAEPGGREKIAGLVTAVQTYWSQPGAPEGKGCCYEMMHVTPAPKLRELRESSQWEIL